MTSEEILEAHRRNRHIANTRGWPFVLIGFLGFGLGVLSQAGPTPSLFGLVILFVAVLVMIAGLRTVSRYTRCPACNAPLRASRGLLVNAAACPRCGVQLR